MANSYEVRSGDTLSEIAASHGVKWQDIAKVNKLKNPNKIFPGNILTIPSTQEQPQAAPVEPPKKPAVPVKEVGRTDPYDDAISVEVVQEPPASTASSRTTSEGSGPKESEAWGPGHSKSYPALVGEPGSSERLSSMYEQMKYGDFWMDWLDQALPTAVQGAGPGAANALIRSASALRRLASDTEFMKLPDSQDPMAKWLFKNMKYFDRNQDPNYKLPDAGSEIRMDAVGNRPLAMRAVDPRPTGKDFLAELVRGFSPGSAESTVAQDVNILSKQVQDVLQDAGEIDKNTTTVPKNSTTATKSKEKP